jgi:hypothetical protein
MIRESTNRIYLEIRKVQMICVHRQLQMGFLSDKLRLKNFTLQDVRNDHQAPDHRAARQA